VRLPAPPRLELSLDAGAGASFATAHITAQPGPGAANVDATARALALQGGVEAAFPLNPGRLVVGLRYLWISLGRTSHGDDLTGNSAGLLGDVGYRMTW
jgi:hypothetical protein